MTVTHCYRLGAYLFFGPRPEMQNCLHDLLSKDWCLVSGYWGWRGRGGQHVQSACGGHGQQAMCTILMQSPLHARYYKHPGNVPTGNSR